MERYTIYCTEEQIKKALELGAPIEESIDYNTDGHLVTMGYMLNGEVNEKNLNGFGWANILRIPTAEQMINWLEEQGLICDIFPLEDDRDKRAFAFRIGVKWNKYESDAQDYTLRKEATLAAIDAALEYLSKNKK